MLVLEVACLRFRSYLPVVANVGLRGLTLGCKFLLVFVLAYYLESSELGLYGLLTVTVFYSTYPLGFEFYTYSSRQMVRAKRDGRKSILKNQLALHAVLYLIVLPLLLVVFYLELLPYEYIFYFYILVVLEHLNQEVMRLLIAMQHQLVASFALFFRQGAWAVIVAGAMFFSQKYRTLECVLFFWVIGSALALALSGYKIWELSCKDTKLHARVNWEWIRNGLKVALPLFIASLSTNFIATADRYWFEHLNGLETLGAYVFYASIAASLSTFMDAGIFSFIYPRLLANHADKNYCAFGRNFQAMLIQVSIVSTILLLAVVFLSGWLFQFMGKDIFIEYIYVFYILVFAVVVQCFSYIPHYGLYALGKDRHIVISNVIMVPVFIGCVLVLIEISQIIAVPLALVFIGLLSLLYKFVFFLKSYRVIKVMI